MLLAARAFVDEGGQVGLGRSPAREAGDLQRPHEIFHPGHAVVGPGVRLPGDDRRDLPVAREGGALAPALPESPQVDPQDGREEGRAGGAVGGVEEAAHRRREAVHGAQPGVGQGQAAEEARDGEVDADGLRRVALEGPAQGAGRAGEALAAEAVDEGVGADGDERLDELGERVEAARGHDVRREADQEVGVDDRGAGQHQRAAQARLHSVLGRGEDGVARHLRAGAGGRRDGHERSGGPPDRLPAADDLQVVERVAAVAEEGGHGLAGVDRAAAPAGHHQVDALGAGGGCPAPHVGDGRLAGGRKRHDREARRRQGVARGGGPLDGAPGDEERPAAEGSSDLREAGHRSGAEEDAGRRGELEPHDATPSRSHPGETLTYFSLRRGSAIRSATVSRHAA